MSEKTILSVTSGNVDENSEACFCYRVGKRWDWFDKDSPKVERIARILKPDRDYMTRWISVWAGGKIVAEAQEAFVGEITYA